MGTEPRDLDYEADVLSCIDWRGYDPKDIAARIPDNAQAAESQLQRIKLSDDGDELFVGETVAENAETLALDPAHAVRMISDIVPNPFVGWEIVAKLLSALKVRGFDEAKLGGLASLIVGELRKSLDTERTVRAEALFKAEVKGGRIQFRLRLDHLDHLDTAYKREVLSFLSDNLGWNDFTPAGELELIQGNGETVQGTLILMSEWQTKLPEYLRGVDQDA